MLSVKVTVPVGTLGGATGTTFAVRVTDLSGGAGLALEETMMAVAAALEAGVMSWVRWGGGGVEVGCGGVDGVDGMGAGGEG